MTHENARTRARERLRLDPVRRAAPLSAAAQIALVAALLAVAAGCWALTGDRMDGMDAGPGTALGGLGWFLVELGGDDGRDDAAGRSAPMAVAHARLQRPPAERGGRADRRLRASSPATCSRGAPSGWSPTP